MERDGPSKQDKVLTGKEIARMNTGRVVSSILDSEPWATIRLDNGMYAYDPVIGLNVFDKDNNPIDPNDALAIIRRRTPKDSIK